jgi:homeobox-leucine zipper protein
MYLVIGRCREKQRKEASRLQTVNRKLSAMNKLLMEENDRLQKQVSRLVYENGYMRTHLNNVRFYPITYYYFC